LVLLFGGVSATKNVSNAEKHFKRFIFPPLR
jgi:hypothetical protein